MDPHDELFPSVVIAGMRTAVALSLNPATNVRVIACENGTLRDGQEPVSD